MFGNVNLVGGNNDALFKAMHKELTESTDIIIKPFSHFFTIFPKSPNPEQKRVYYQTEIGKLPSDVLGLVLNQLDLTQLRKITRVCKTWNALINSESFLRGYAQTLNSAILREDVNARINCVKLGLEFQAKIHESLEPFINISFEKLPEIQLDPDLADFNVIKPAEKQS